MTLTTPEEAAGILRAYAASVAGNRQDWDYFEQEATALIERVIAEYLRIGAIAGREAAHRRLPHLGMVT